MSSKLNRRGFMAAAGATGVAASLITADASHAAAVQNANRRVIVGVMGTGGRGTGLASAFARLPNVEVSVVCDVDAARVGRASAAVAKVTGRPGPRAVEDFRRILDDKAVDLLVVATCNHWHAPAAILACAAGKHVYVEKPCSYNPREGELLVQAARKHRRNVQMGNQRRSYAGVIRAMDELRNGAIGRVYMAQSWYQSNRGPTGRGKPADVPKGLNYALWQGPAPHRPFRDNYLHYKWHWFWHWGNGELGNNGIHIIDLCRWGLGVDYPTRVVSSGGRYRFDDDQETPDSHVVSFEFEGRKQITWEGFSCSRQIARPYHALFHGERGTMTLSDTSYAFFDPAGKETRREKVQSGDTPHFNNLLAAIRNNERLNSEILEGHKSTLLCHLGNIAHRTGRTIRCNSKDGTILNDKEAAALWTREYQKGFEPRV
ncbi:MAG: Gfo/Idh/MocA family oxidoreductase [Planctomycetes bacterium]|nr:Gfo/Idh/MocA family oxidoreductase [Planctomycetota bacterium]